MFDVIKPYLIEKFYDRGAIHLRSIMWRDGLSWSNASDSVASSGTRGNAPRTNQMFDVIKPYLIESFYDRGAIHLRSIMWRDGRAGRMRLTRNQIYS